jgi:hypothetical protein
MAIQDEMYKMIEKEINQTVAEDRQNIIVDYDKAKVVAKMLAELSTEREDADSLVNQYMAQIKNICRN